MRKNGEVDGIMQFTAIVPMMLRMMVQTTGNHRLLLKKRVKLQTLKKCCSFCGCCGCLWIQHKCYMTCNSTLGLINNIN